ncbi:hypothetical protein CGRA01v4_08722 [Colletotrichum graminicola]|nr:hypothetical protein CGRA01v4_08722 [Colletotrichum graminicola]
MPAFQTLLHCHAFTCILLVVYFYPRKENTLGPAIVRSYSSCLSFTRVSLASPHSLYGLLIVLVMIVQR